jgi:hypothetical protein
MTIGVRLRIGWRARVDSNHRLLPTTTASNDIIGHGGSCEPSNGRWEASWRTPINHGRHFQPALPPRSDHRLDGPTRLSLGMGCFPAEPASVSPGTVIIAFGFMPPVAGGGRCRRASTSLRSRIAWISAGRQASMSRGVTYPIALCSRTVLE